MSRLLQLSPLKRSLGSSGHQGMALLLIGPLASCQVLLVALVASASLVMPVQAAALQLPALMPGGLVSCASGAGARAAVKPDQEDVLAERTCRPAAVADLTTHVGALHQALGGRHHHRVCADQAGPRAQLRLAERRRLGLGQRLVWVQHHLEGAGAGGEVAGGGCGGIGGFIYGPLPGSSQLAATQADHPIQLKSMLLSPGSAGTHHCPAGRLGGTASTIRLRSGAGRGLPGFRKAALAINSAAKCSGCCQAQWQAAHSGASRGRRRRRFGPGTPHRRRAHVHSCRTCIAAAPPRPPHWSNLRNKPPPAPAAAAAAAAAASGSCCSLRWLGEVAGRLAASTAVLCVQYQQSFPAPEASFIAELSHETLLHRCSAASRCAPAVARRRLRHLDSIPASPPKARRAAPGPGRRVAAPRER